MEEKNFEGIEYSRFAASWWGSKVSAAEHHAKEMGFDFYRFTGHIAMVKWLMSLTINGKQIPEKIAHEIADYTETGKFELEQSAYKFQIGVMHKSNKGKKLKEIFGKY